MSKWILSGDMSQSYCDDRGRDTMINCAEAVEQVARGRMLIIVDNEERGKRRRFLYRRGKGDAGRDQYYGDQRPRVNMLSHRIFHREPAPSSCPSPAQQRAARHQFYR